MTFFAAVNSLLTEALQPSAIFSKLTECTAKNKFLCFTAMFSISRDVRFTIMQTSSKLNHV
jgi:hypothetical protein